MDCIFCKILKSEIPSTKVYEDDQVYAFRDINPVSPTHILVIPKKHLATINQTEDFNIYSSIFQAITKIVQQENLTDRGYRVVANCNQDGGQVVYHIHFHILGGREFHWPPG